MRDDELVEIPLSKVKIWLMILGSIGFVVASIWIGSKSLVVLPVSIIGAAFFGTIGVIGLKKIFDQKPGLVLTKEGFHDNSSGVSLGFVKWADVVGVEVMKMKRTRFLVVLLRNPDEYIQREKAKWKARLLEANWKMSGSPVTIASNVLSINFTQLEEVFFTKTPPFLG